MRSEGKRGLREEVLEKNLKEIRMDGGVKDREMK